MGCRDRGKRGAESAACLLAALVTIGVATLASVGSSGAQASGLSGGAYGHYTNVGLFGGPPGANGPAPVVTLPPTGADPALTATEPSAQAVYGPAKIFGGKYPDKAAAAPPSGPIKVTTTGKTGPGGFVTSTAEIVRHPTPVGVQCEGEPAGSTNCKAVGGFGPNPPTEGDELHSTCTADASGATGSARFVNALVSLATDADGNPIQTEPVPDNPPVNYTREGQLTNVGDNFRIVFNEQIKGADGSITVNAVHLFLLGPVAIGEQILGQVRCSAGGAVSPGASTPSSSAPTTVTTSPTSTTPTTPTVPPDEANSGGSALPVALGGGAVVLAGAAGLAMWARSRRGKDAGEPPLN